MKKKKWWQSKTLWANVVAIIAVVISSQRGIELDAEAQALIVTLIFGVMNIILRIYTKQPVK
ncbi:hypothetical protein LCGC14_0416570 [marine sediment metagenome]|uniref:Uncharacterized protein n=1 Tax=marine sediment metagenome TaxID=412755 RepID=A0A0F9W186_9ZZZZ